MHKTDKQIVEKSSSHIAFVASHLHFWYWLPHNLPFNPVTHSNTPSTITLRAMFRCLQMSTMPRCSSNQSYWITKRADRKQRFTFIINGSQFLKTNTVSHKSNTQIEALVAANASHILEIACTTDPHGRTPGYVYDYTVAGPTNWFPGGKTNDLALTTFDFDLSNASFM